MPRLPPWLFRRARRVSPHVATLLPACRDLPSSLQELRWITQHVHETHNSLHGHHIAKLCGRRGRGEPLQYVLGSQPFGSLDLRCEPGVLIPRSETEAYTSYLAQLILDGTLWDRQAEQREGRLNVIDFCTGTGAIPLLLFSTLHAAFSKLNVCGIDISPVALALAQKNIARNVALDSLPSSTRDKQLSIIPGDVFDHGIIAELSATNWDIMISNPPYVAKDVWDNGRGQLGPSVRKFEPRLALVPEDDLDVPPHVRHEDVFYARLLDIAESLRPRSMLLEIGDEEQAARVIDLVQRHGLASRSSVEVWRDWPDLGPDEGDLSATFEPEFKNMKVPVRGGGRVRSVLMHINWQD